MKLSRFVAPAAVVLLAAGLVAASAIHVQWWHAAHVVLFEAARAAALDAARDGAAAGAELDTARGAAPALSEDAADVAAVAPGYLGSTELSALESALEELEEALAVEAVDGETMPTPAVSDLTRLDDTAAQLSAWAEAESARAAVVAATAAKLTDSTHSLRVALESLVGTAADEATAALGAAPLASAETRAAVEAARDALTAARDDGRPLAEAAKAYADAVANLRWSQQQGADAAAAREESGGSDQDDLGRQLLEVFIDPNDPNCHHIGPGPYDYVCY